MDDSSMTEHEGEPVEEANEAPQEPVTSVQEEKPVEQPREKTDEELEREDRERGKFPMAAHVFVRSIKTSLHGVYGKALLLQHGAEKHTAEEWHGLLHKIRSAPVKYEG